LDVQQSRFEFFQIGGSLGTLRMGQRAISSRNLHSVRGPYKPIAAMTTTMLAEIEVNMPGVSTQPSSSAIM